MEPKALIYRWRDAWMVSELRFGTRMVLQVLFDRMSKDGGDCWPSTEWIAERAGMTRKTAEKHIALAIQAGWISRVRREGKGHKATYLYTPTFGVSSTHNAEATNGVSATHKVGGTFGVNDDQPIGKDLPTNTPCNKPVKENPLIGGERKATDGAVRVGDILDEVLKARGYDFQPGDPSHPPQPMAS